MRFVALSVCLLSAYGCANSISGVRAERAHGGGTARVYELPAPAAYAASVRVLRAEGIDVIEEHAADGYMLAHKEPGPPPNYGAYVGVWVEPSGPDHAKVTVVSQREHAGDVFSGLTEGGFHDELARELAAGGAKQ